MRNFSRFSKQVMVACAALLLTSAVSHATLTYGDLNGPNISYLHITESNTQLIGPPVVNTTPNQLYGAPMLSPPGSDTLSFPSMSFQAAGADGQFEFQDGKLTMNIAPSTINSVLHSLTFDEGGAWRLIGPDFTSSPSTASSVTATMLFNDLRITSLDGIPLSSPIIVAPTFSSSASPQTGTAHVNQTSGNIVISSAGNDAAGTWDINAAFNLDAALTGAGKTGRITSISVALDNQLLAQTSDLANLTLASIDKKHLFVSGATTILDVPEPASLSVLLLGGLMFRRRRAA